MNQNQDTDSNSEKEQVTESGAPFSPEINPEIEEHPDKDPLTNLKMELAEAKDKFLRVYSEFDNYKKRSIRERSELLKTANSEVMIALLPVLDDFERAAKAMENSVSDGASKEGVALIYHKLKSILEQKGLMRMKSIGEVFDVDLHEAITEIPATTESQKGKVIDEAESGYFLNGKVIRHAKVIVAG